MKKTKLLLSVLLISVCAIAQTPKNSIPKSEYSRVSLGAQFGVPYILSDVPMDVVNFGYGGYLKYSMSHILGLRAQYMAGKITGSPISTAQEIDSAWYTNNIQVVSLQTVFNLGSLSFRKNSPKNSLYFGLGFGTFFNNASRDKFDTSKPQLKYTDWDFTIPVSIGYKRKLSKNFDFGIEASMFLTRDDLIDLYNVQSSKFPDFFGFGTVNLVYNITSKKRQNHIDWANPVEKMYKEINDNKKALAAYKMDTDGDGVPDSYDLEPNTKAGFKVDSRGRTLDSDGDGIPDTEDPDPYGFQQALQTYYPSGNLSTDSLARIYRIKDSIPETNFYWTSAESQGLPIITFEPLKSVVHVEQYPLLQQIARIMQLDTSFTLMIIGHSDNSKTDMTQFNLAEKRALEVKRKLMKIFEIKNERLFVFSERDPYVQKFKLKSEGLERKAEFRLMKPGDMKKD